MAAVKKKHRGTTKFVKPVHAGGKLRVRLTIENKHLSGKPGRGVITIFQELLNQAGEVVTYERGRDAVGNSADPVGSLAIVTISMRYLIRPVLLRRISGHADEKPFPSSVSPFFYMILRPTFGY